MSSIDLMRSSRRDTSGQNASVQAQAHLRRRNKLTGREALRITQVEAVSREPHRRQKPRAQLACYGRAGTVPAARNATILGRSRSTFRKYGAARARRKTIAAMPAPIRSECDRFGRDQRIVELLLGRVSLITPALNVGGALDYKLRRRARQSAIVR